MINYSNTQLMYKTPNFTNIEYLTHVCRERQQGLSYVECVWQMKKLTVNCGSNHQDENAECMSKC